MYEMRKVFDCQNMPNDVRTKFFVEMCECSNDCYVSWWPQTATFVDDDGTTQPNEDHTIVDAWLLDNGAEPDECVLVQHWW
jgi:hypothetical protein